MKKDLALKIGQTLFHRGAFRIIKCNITDVESNNDGIYIYATGDDGKQYRFILITYAYGKTHFGRQVFTTEKEAQEYFNGID